MMPTIRETRVGQDMGLRQLAEEAGIAVKTLQNLEAGKPVRRSVAMKVCNVLGVDLKTVTGLKLYSAVQTADRIRRQAKE